MQRRVNMLVAMEKSVSLSFIRVGLHPNIWSYSKSLLWFFTIVKTIAQ